MAEFVIIKDGKEISVERALSIAETNIILPYDPAGAYDERSDNFVFACLRKLKVTDLIDRFEVKGELEKFESREGVIY